MTINRHLAHTLRETRALQRDAAAAEHASSSDHRMRAQDILAAASAELEESLTEAPAALQRAHSVAELEQVSEHLAAQRAQVAQAQDALAAAAAKAQDTESKLRECNRQAHCAAQLAQRAQRAHAAAEQRQEQVRHDDLRRRSSRDTSPR